MTHRLRTALAIGALITPLSAQISVEGQPASDWAGLVSDVPTAVMPPVDVESLIAEDEDLGPFPLRYGDVLTTDLGITNAGVWEMVPADDSLVWRLRIESPGAYSLGIVFTEYELPAGAEVFLYDDEKSYVLGAYTAHNNNPNGLLGIEPVFTDSVTIEYVQQSWATGTPKLHVGEVIHDYKGLRNLLEASAPGGTSGADGGCGKVGINCPEGAPYQTVKRAVMRTLAGGGLCSASLLNNTNSDATPYMLTANHCGNMSGGTFLFKYEQATCGTSSGPTGSTVSGAVRLAFSSTYDSQLYRLNTTPPSSFDPYWAGWSRASFSGSPATTIGHGDGGPKNIAIDNTGASVAGTQWQVFWHTGYITGGNSGGPLFNGDKRVIGPACCVNTFTCGAQTAWYGRLDLFYNAFNLGQWLDPAGTGTIVLDGLDPFAAPPVITSISPDTVPIFGPGTVTLTGSGFLGTSSVKVGSTSLTAPIGFVIVDDNTITFSPPGTSSLGTVQVEVVKTSGSSSPVNLTYIETDPPKMTATGFGVSEVFSNGTSAVSRTTTGSCLWG